MKSKDEEEIRRRQRAALTATGAMTPSEVRASDTARWEPVRASEAALRREQEYVKQVKEQEAQAAWNRESHRLAMEALKKKNKNNG